MTVAYIETPVNNTHKENPTSKLVTFQIENILLYCLHGLEESMAVELTNPQYRARIYFEVLLKRFHLNNNLPDAKFLTVSIQEKEPIG